MKPSPKCRFRQICPGPASLWWSAAYNGERTIRDCLEGLLELEYPDYEVIVVDDGSTDATARSPASTTFASSARRIGA